MSCLSNWTVREITRALKWLFFITSKKNWDFFCFDFKKGPYISQILLKLWLIGNRTSCRPIQSVIILVIKQIGPPLRGRPIRLTTRMITDRIGLHSVLLLVLNVLECVTMQLAWFGNWMQLLFFANVKIIVQNDWPITEVKIYSDLVGIGRVSSPPLTRNLQR